MIYPLIPPIVAATPDWFPGAGSPIPDEIATHHRSSTDRRESIRSP